MKKRTRLRRIKRTAPRKKLKKRVRRRIRRLKGGSILDYFNPMFYAKKALGAIGI